MAGAKEIFSTWLAGGDLSQGESMSTGSEAPVYASESTVDGPEGVVIAGSGEQDQGQQDSQVAAEDSTEEQASPLETSDTAAPKISPDREKITISDDKGRREVEIDYSNKDQVRKAFQMAYGARKWQAERDAARAEVAQAKASSSEIKSNWDALEGAFSKSGIEGVINLLEGKPDAYAQHIQKQIERRKFIERATPEELTSMAAQELAEAKSREAAELKRKYDELEQKVNSKQAETEDQLVESRIVPAFDKHRFADKLGDPATEALFDRMLWKEVLDNLTPYEEKYGSASAIPQEIVEKEFRTAAATMRKTMNVQAEKKAGRIVEQKKQEATENVQSRVQAGYKPNSNAKEVQELLKKGDTKSLIRNWGRLGK